MSSGHFGFGSIASIGALGASAFHPLRKFKLTNYRSATKFDGTLGL
jgi:hypothetical protein